MFVILIIPIEGFVVYNPLVAETKELLFSSGIRIVHNYHSFFKWA